MVDDYRARIYHRYASIMQDSEPFFNEGEARRWGWAYDHYFRGWLPEKKDAAIVDLGCGSGRLLHFFRGRGYTNIRGVDISPEQVALARQVVPGVSHSNVLDFLKSHQDSFDLITGLDIIEHFQKDEILRFLDLCHQALRSGGRLILQTPNAESPLSTSIRYGDFSHEICFNPNSLVRLMRMCGFEQVKAREQGPVPWGYSFISTIRYSIWQFIRIALKVWNIAETGSPGSGVLTRVFIVCGIRL